MRHINNFEQFNENILGDIARLNPERKQNDDKFSKLIDDVIEDFNKNGKDLRKVHIIDDSKDNEISFSKIEVGKSYSFRYVFGKYHPVKRNLFTGNKANWDRRIKIVKVPFSITLSRDSLERFFKTKRVNMGYSRVEDEVAVPNYERNPNIGNHALHKPKKDEYKVSADLANYLFNFFLEEYNKQYPDLKDIRNKNSMDISDIEKGIAPTVKYITVKSKDGEELTYGLRKGEDEKEVRQKLSNMTKSEYDKYWRKRREEIYADSTKKQEEKDEIIRSKFNEVVKMLDVKIEGDWNRVQVFSDYEVRIELGTKDPKIETTIKNIPKEFDGYKLTHTRVTDSYKGELKFATIVYEKE